MKTKYKKMFKWTVGSLLVFVCLIGVIVGIINGIQITQANEISTKGIVVDTIINIVLGIISAILSLLFIVIKPLVQIAIICLQNAIYVLTIYPLWANIFTGDYWVFLASIASLFGFFMIVFLVLNWWKQSHSYQKESFDWINLAKAVVTLVLMPIILMLVMALGQLIAYGIFGMNNIYDVSIYQLIEDATLNNVNIDWGDGVLTNYSEEFFKMFLFIVAGGFTIYFLFWFAISLGTRLFELIAFGIAGVVVASSSQVYDEGEMKMNKIVNGEEKIVGKAKFRREVNWLWLGKLFDDERVSFVLEINSLEAMFYHWKNGVYPTIGETIANSYPFENQTYLDETGVYLGTIEGRYPFIYDSWSKKDKSNWHTLLIGSSGSGKTTLMKYLVGSELATNKGRHIILDPHNEFGVLAKKNNKVKVFNLGDIKLNPLKFERVDKNNWEKVLKEKILFLKEFFRLIYRQEVDSDFNKELQKLLLSFEEKFNQLKGEIIDGKKFRFSDLKIDNELLNPLIKGIYKDFNQYETFSLKERLVVLEGKELWLMEETFRNSIIFLVMNRINEVIYANQEKQEQINLYLDEAGKFLRNEFLIQKLSPLFSEARKFRTKLTIATQNLTDLYNGDSKDVNLANIFANASNTFIGYLKNDQRKLLDELLQEGKGRELTTNEHHHINQKQGHWLYLMDNTRLAFKSLYDEDINEIVGVE